MRGIWLTLEHGGVGGSKKYRPVTAFVTLDSHKNQRRLVRSTQASSAGPGTEEEEEEDDKRPLSAGVAGRVGELEGGVVVGGWKCERAPTTES
eukprot:COSAG01_NODE_533_length_15816_cov_4.518738_14_plen_93_part_00